jgi:hypothetical protein
MHSYHADVVEADELEQLRACAHYIGALRPGKAAWLGRVLRERVRAGAARAGQRTASTPRDLTSTGRRLIREAARHSAVAASLSSVCANLAELATLLTEGVAGPLGAVIALGSVAFDTVYVAIVQIDLACDLAALYGVPFDVADVGELATLLDVALIPSTSSREAGRSRLLRWLAPPDREVLRRLARGLLENAAVGLVPLAGLPWAAARSYLGTRRVGVRIHRYVRSRRTIRETLNHVLADPRLDKARLLEGAWLLAACDEEVTHDEIALLSALVRSIPREMRPPVACLRFVGEGIWVVRMTLLEDENRRRIVAALQTIAALRGPMTENERAFLRRISEGLGEPIDLAHVERLHARFVTAPGARAAEASPPARGGRYPWRLPRLGWLRRTTAWASSGTRTPP